MKKSYLIFLLLLTNGLYNHLFAQEICNNGIDDDNNGFVDCYDNSCAGAAACEDFFMGAEATCEVEPTEFPAFTMKMAWGSADETAATWSRVSVGDVDGDGIPEVIVTNRQTNKLFILNGDDGTIKQQINLDYAPEHGVALADLEGDGYAEFFVSGRDRTIEGYTYNPATGQFERMWRQDSDAEGGEEKGRPVVLGLADFEGTGDVQLYYKNEIRDAKTGTRIVNGTGNWEFDDNFAPVAVDILGDSECSDCSGLELVSGGSIYSVDLGDGTKDSGKLTVIESLSDDGPDYFVKESGWDENFSATSIADFNQDGHLDVIASGALNDVHGPTTVFFWDVENDTVMTYSPPNNWAQGMGRPNIADIDGDGALNVTFVSGNRLFALDENFNLLWEVPINEQTSGFTGTTVFDFNGDGAYEIVYRDERNLYIINGETGVPYQTIPCRSRTSSEYPVVADVDGDGATEICVVCNTDDGANEQDGANTRHGQVRVYESDGETWVPSRKVWNQHTYFNVNINDDLTIPREQQQHHLVFSDEDCSGSGMPNRPLNTFLNQSPYLTPQGCLSFGAPDFTVLSSTLQVTPPVCPENDFSLSFDVRNDGQLSVSGSVPITFYEGNPQTTAGVKLNTIYVEVLNLMPGETFSATGLVVNGIGSAFDLYVAFNDAGAVAPPITFPNGGLLECNYDNNVLSSRITPDPFVVTIEKIKNNFKCDGAAANNGAARAYVLQGTDKVTAGYTFYWYNGTAVKPTPDFTGAVYTDLSEGDYTVRAINNAALCGSTVETVTIDVSFQSIDSVEVEVTKKVTQCDQGDGELRAHVWKNGAKYYESDGYTFTWYKSAYINNPDSIVAIGSVASNLEEEAYSVVVTDESTGCRSIGSASVGSNLTKPVVDVEIEREVTRCNQPSGGKLRATVDGNTESYKFRWYDGNEVKIVADKTGPVYPDLEAGEYTVVAINKETGCFSDPTTVTIGSTIADPEVVFTDSVSQTSCGIPNGLLSIDFSTPAPADEPDRGYRITWFQGDTPSAPEVPDHKISADGKTASQLSEGWYTVRVENRDSRCYTVATKYVYDEVVYPEVEATATPNTVCNEDFAPFNGSIAATVTLAGAPVTDLSDYAFTWYEGSSTAGEDIIAGESAATLENQPAGTYTVVVTRLSTSCPSPPQIVEIADSITRPVIGITELAPQTHCDPATPNGQLEVSVDGPLENYLIEWFVGSGTTTPLTSSKLAGTNGEKAVNLSAQTYTVRVTDLATGCSRLDSEFLDKATHTPVVSVTATGINTHCSKDYSPYTGSLTASVTVDGVAADVSDYTFTWYQGDITGSVIASENAAVLDNREGGTYTVVATHKTLACTSSPVSADIENNLTFPDIQINPVSHQTNCDPNNPDGHLSASVTLTNPEDFYFEWVGPDGSPLPAKKVAGSYGEEAVDLTRGTYTVTVTHKITGCSEFEDFTLEDKVSDVRISAEVFNNTICDPFIAPGVTYDGRIAASVRVFVDGTEVTDIDINDFTFHWYKGGDPNTATPLNVDGPDLENLEAGKYIVYAVEDSSRCSSDPITVEVENEQVIPQVTFTATPQTHCDPADSPNGELLVSLDGPLEDYTIEWFVGNGTTTPLSSTNITGTSNEKAIQLTAGQYTVRATNKATGCLTVKGIYLPDNIRYPELELHATTNTICDPALVTGGGEFTGSITATIEFNNTPVTDFSDYTFTWYEVLEGKPDSEITDNISGNLLKGLDQGEYKVIVTKNSLECTSVAATIEIEDEITKPEIVFDNSAETHCSTPNGILSASVNTVTAGYSFEWFDENNLSIGTGPVLTDMSSGDYSVMVINQSSGCSRTAYTFLADSIQVPVITALTALDNTICDTALTAAGQYNGAITADITFGGTPVSDFSDYTFQWYRGSTADDANEITTNITANSIGKLPAGYYTVVVTKNAVACSSLSKTIEIRDNKVLPDVTIAATPQTHCDPDTPNGALSADVGGVTAGYTFAWFEGNDTSTPLGTNLGSAYDKNSAVADSLPQGNYTVQVTNTATGCISLKSIYLGDQVIQPSLAIDVITPFDNCSTPNGAITTTITSADYAPDGYTYTWYDGTGVTLPVATDSAGGLEPGTYMVAAYNNFTGCTSAPVTAEVADNSEILTIDSADVAITPAQVCNSGSSTNVATGAVEIKRISGLDATDPAFDVKFDFQWYVGRPETPGMTDFPDPPLEWNAEATGKQTNHLQQLVTGVYTVVITNTENGCATVITYDVPPLDQEGLDLVNTHRQHITSCDVDNGEIRVALENTPPGKDATDYTFAWFRGSNVKATTDFPGETTNILTGLAPGTYTAIATQNFGSYCSSAPLTITLYQVAQPPVVTLDNIVPNSFCAGSDGQITVSADTMTVYGRIPNNIIALDTIADDDGLGYTFAWYAGQTATGTAIATGVTNSDTASTITNLAPGAYTVRVTNVQTTCFVDMTYEVAHQPDAPVIVAYTSTDQNICGPSGSITVTEIESVYSGPRNISDYTFTWYRGSVHADSVITGESSATIDPLMAGTYYVVATTASGKGTGCASAAAEIVINDTSVRPDLVFAQTPNTACDLNFADGALTVTADPAGAPVPAGSSFEWFIIAGDGTRSPFTDGTDGAVSTTGNTSTISGVKPGVYAVKVTDNATGCFREEQHRVENAPVKPVISTAAITDQIICGPSGSITITDADVTSGETDDYVFTWYRGSKSAGDIIAGVTGPLLDVSNYPTIGAGTYYVIATKDNGTNRGCSSVAYSAEIRDTSQPPVVDLAGTGIVPNTFCAGGFDGSITLEASSHIDDPVAATTFSYAWTSNTAATPPDSLGVNPGEAVTFSGLAAGTYTVTVTSDATGCSTTAEYTVGDQEYIPVIDPSKFAVTHQDRCYNWGRIEVTDTAVTVSPGGLADYIFTWYRGLVHADSAISAVTGPVLDQNNYPAMAAGTYWVVATKKTGISGKGQGCVSAPVAIRIDDISQDPMVELAGTGIMPNTFCAGGFDGSITLQASSHSDDPVTATTFSITWTSNTATTPPDSLGVKPGDSVTFSGLAPGDYTVTVTSDTTGCSTMAKYTVGEQEYIPVINASKVVISHQDRCYNWGRIEIADTAVTASGNGVDDYIFTWYKDSTDPANQITGVTGPVLDQNNYPAMAAGTYLVIATKKTGISGKGQGCASAPVAIRIDDISKDPVVEVSGTPNTFCTGFDGSITLKASSHSDDPVTATTFSITWTSNTTTTPADSIGVSGDQVFSGLEDGVYWVTVTSDTTGCSTTAKYTVGKEEYIPEIDPANVLVTHQDRCDNWGAIEITDAAVTASGNGVDDYTFTWYRGLVHADSVISAVTGPVLDLGNYPAISAGTYWVVATKKTGVTGKGEGCSSLAQAIEIRDISQPPVITQVGDIMPNTFCAGFDGSITLKASHDATNPVAADKFSYTWTSNTDTTPADSTGVEVDEAVTFSGLAPGDYWVTVTSVATGCSRTASYTVREALDKPMQVSLDVTPQTICFPSGNIQVTGITSITGNRSIGEYTYTWYRGTADAANIIPGVTGPRLDNLNYPQIGSDIYYVTATAIAGTGVGCALTKRVIIEDVSKDPEIQATAYSPQTRCDLTQPNGALTINLDGQTDFTPYEIKWYAGNVGDTLQAAGMEISTTNAITEQPAGDYTVQVYNTLTGCSAYKVFTIEDNIVTPIVHVYTEGVSSCNSPNGKAYALIKNVRGDFVYEWYEGIHTTYPGTAHGDYIATSRQGISSLDIGDYTVFALEQGGNLCAVSQTFRVEDIRVYPEDIVFHASPLTNCDAEFPEKANGQLSATMGGLVSGYTFEWYLGETVTGTPFYIGPTTPSTLTSTTYTVNVTNNLTGCAAYASYTVGEDQETVPPPVVTVTDRTNCETPNGSLQASVTGRVNDYRFNWYEGKKVKPSRQLNESGPVLSGLGAGPYTVTVTSLVTGCTSAPVHIEVGENYTYPEFNIETTNATCELVNGRARLEITAGNVTRISWDTGTGIINGLSTVELQAGNYTVTLTTADGCSTTKTFTIGSDVLVYNGVSPNGDFQNDILVIDCIQLYPSNNVKIFNRAGTLVFEVNGYDNNEKYFEGTGNRGIYLTGDELPDGTYFYVVEKNDGSEARTGYLELIR